MSALTVEQWRLFVQIADHGSLTRAAAARDVAQSAVSRQLAMIEQQCGAKLFERHGRGVRMTAAGVNLYPRVVGWLQSGEALTRDLQVAAEAPSGEVRLGVLASLELDPVVRICQQVRERFPGIRLRVVSGNGARLADWLDEGSIDLAVLFRNGREGRRDEELLATVPQVLVGPPGDVLTRGPTVAFRRLDGIPLVLPGPGAIRELLSHWAQRRGIQLNIAIECDAFVVLKRLVSQMGLYTVLGAQGVQADVAAGRIQASRIVEPALERRITLGLSECHSPSLACQEVSRIVRETIAPLLEGYGRESVNA